MEKRYTERWKKIEQWMERRYNMNMSMKPKKMAAMFMAYSKISHVMRPMILKLAQKVKARLLQRTLQSKTAG